MTFVFQEVYNKPFCNIVFIRRILMQNDEACSESNVGTYYLL